MKRLKTLTAVLMAVIMTAMIPCRAIAATPKYISDVLVATGNSLAAAKKKLTSQGYTVAAVNVNDGNDTAVCIGYKTTTDSSEAITDLTVMNMNGGYSFEDYENVLNEFKEKTNTIIDNIYASVTEFRANYKANKPTAILAYNMLNKMTDEDYEENNGIGDILVNENTTKDELSVIFLQATTLAVNTIEVYLEIGCIDNFIDRFTQSSSKGTYDVSVDDDARTIYSSLSYFRDEIAEYEESFAKIEAKDEYTDEEMEAAIEALDEEDKLVIANFGSLYASLEATEYNGGTLLDFFKQDLESMDNSVLYPLAASMTAGQIASLPYASMSTALKYAFMDDETMNTMIESAEDESTTISVFEGVDRSIYEADGIALTNEAMRKATSSSDTSWYKGNLSKTAETVFYSIMGAASVVSAIGITVWAFSASKWAALESSIYTIKFAAIPWSTFESTSELALGVLNTGEAATFTETVPYIEAGAIEVAREEAAAEAANSIWAQVTAVSKVVTGIAIAVLLITVAVYLITEYVKYNSKHVDYLTIPRIIVDETTTSDGDRNYTYYYAVKNTDGEYADLNNFKGFEWNALYYTKDKNAGKPILASALIQTDSNVSSDSSYDRSIHAFGSSAAYNLNKYAKSGSAIYMFLKSGEESSSNLAASSFSYSYFAIASAAGFALGAVLTLIITKTVQKKKAK